MPRSGSKADRPLQLESSSRPSLPSLFFSYTDRINTKCYRNVLNTVFLMFILPKHRLIISYFLSEKNVFHKKCFCRNIPHFSAKALLSYSIARICSIRDCFFCLRIVQTDKISSTVTSTTTYTPICNQGNS